MAAAVSHGKPVAKRKALGNGLYLRRDGKYEHGYTDPVTGKWHVVTLKSQTKTEAKKEIAERITRLGKGEVAAPTKITLAELSEDFFAALEGYVASVQRSQGTLEDYRQRYNTHIGPKIGRLPVQSIQAAQVARVLREVSEGGASSWTVHGVLTTMASLFEHARTRGIISESPTKRLSKSERPRVKNVREVHILTPEQLRDLIGAGSDGWRSFLTVLSFTGLRASEALGLRWQDVDTSNGVLHIRHQWNRSGGLTSLKTDGSRRDIDMAPPLKKVLLADYMAASDKSPTAFVFCAESGRPKSYVNARRAFTAAVKRANLETGEARLSMHSLRHTFASALIRANVDVVRVSRTLGHAKVSTTLDVYAALFAARQSEGMGDLIGAALEA